MAVFNVKELSKYLALKYNVMFIGYHGVGKSTVVKQMFTEKYGANGWKYFSAPTLDPWVDFVGIPKTTVDAQGVESLKLIRPEFLVRGGVKAIFLDELNRAPAKVLDAVMELIQFKSINGFPLPDLEVVWCAINPPDETGRYQVAELDPALIDRFHVHVNIPFKLDTDYLCTLFPKDVVTIFSDWWNKLPKDAKFLVSPRRVEYAIGAWISGCRLNDFIPASCGVNELRKALANRPFKDQISAISTAEEAKAFLSDINNVNDMLELVKNEDRGATNFFKTYADKLPRELIEPFIDLIMAKKAGVRLFSNIGEMIDALPDKDRGDQHNTGGVINSVNFALMYANGGSLQNDLVAINLAQPEKLRKLSNRCLDVLDRSTRATVAKMLNGLDPANPIVTPFRHIVELLAKTDKSTFTVATKRRVNTKVYSTGVLKAMDWL